jgi:beta-N-acetylhexosaminidase
MTSTRVHPRLQKPHACLASISQFAMIALAAGLCLAWTADADARAKHKHAVAIKGGTAKVTKIVRHTKKNIRLAAKIMAAKITDPVSISETTVVAEPAAREAPVQQLSRAEIFMTDPGRLERVGRHLIVGFHSFSEVKALVEKRAIAGIFITDHNVRNRPARDIKSDIEALQAIRVEQGLPHLIVAADQEGGAVSRLSPPLKKQMSLGRLLAGLTHDDERRKAVEDYAGTQAEELKRMGVTLNFAPVVDLKLNPSNRDDGETRLRLRAIAADPYLVAKVAGWYCDKVAASGIMCTLKHFPGLGRVARDTHVASGEISATAGQLELNDWVPFRNVMSKPNAAMMLGHVRVNIIDKTTPASFSRPVIHDLIRDQWAYDGLLITDDFSMGAVTGSKGGIGAAALKSIDSGVDLVLVSFTEKHLDEVMSTLIAADAESSIDRAVTGASNDRIARIVKAAAEPASP